MFDDNAIYRDIHSQLNRQTLRKRKVFAFFIWKNEFRLKTFKLIRFDIERTKRWQNKFTHRDTSHMLFGCKMCEICVLWREEYKKNKENVYLSRAIAGIKKTKEKFEDVFLVCGFVCAVLNCLMHIPTLTSVVKANTITDKKVCSDLWKVKHQLI